MGDKKYKPSKNFVESVLLISAKDPKLRGTYLGKKLEEKALAEGFNNFFQNNLGYIKNTFK